MSADILIVDDEADIRNLVQGILEDEGYKTRLAEDARRAYAEIAKNPPDLIVLDIWLQGSEHDGLQILANVKERLPDLPIIMISGHGTIETAVSSIKEGAYDFIEKPFKSDRLLLMVQRGLETAQLKRENHALRQRSDAPSELIGDSALISNIKQMLERVAPTNSRILLTGEPGTGKDIAARAIHRLSTRANKPFMVLNCATLRPERLETELFGQATSTHDEPANVGVLERANGGTLLLDEVSDMPLETQGKIVRVLQEQRFTRIGDTQPIEVDVRIIASTNRDLEKAMDEGNFRQDLYYRLNVVPIHMPSLQERIKDIPELVKYFTKLISKQSGLQEKSFSQSALSAIQSYQWPGNIRQLRNVVEWVMIMHGANGVDVFEAEHLPPDFQGKGVYAIHNGSDPAQQAAPDLLDMSLRDAREAFERQYLQSQINRFGGNVSKTAQFVGMERSALHRKLKSLDILGNNGKEDMPDADVVKNRQTA